MRQWLLPILLFFLSLISLLTLRSVAPDLATDQALFFILGFGLFFFISRLEFQQLAHLTTPLYAGLIFLLVVSYLYGLITGRTGRWIPLFGLYNLQPSQLAIPITALMLGQLRGSFQKLKNLLRALTIILVPGILILIEPDLGTSIVYFASTGIILLLSDLGLKKILSLFSLGILATLFSWSFILKPYQKQRITSFLDSSSDTRGANYNARQSLIAAGSGQILGRGLGQGVQSHLRFLPEKHTDFIFASLAEEFGFLGTSIVLGIYILLISKLIQLSLQTQNFAEFSFLTSIATMMIIQTGVNIGMNIGLMPITGLTLPLISYGGSSILSLMLMFGLIKGITKKDQPSESLHIQ